MVHTNTSFKISFCIVSMDRLHHLKQTLPKNIEDNAFYDDLEFIVLDYNSKDDLRGWLQDEMSDYLDNGIVKYFRVENQDYFRRAHSRNMAMKMATGDILVNLDADNYTGEEFADYVNKCFQEKDDIFLRINYKDPEINKFFKDSLGRLCVQKSDFEAVGGYDESMNGYGHEDQDLYYRLEQYGLTKSYYNSTSYLHSISHNREERFKNEKDANRFSRLLVSYLDQNTSTAVFLFDDGTFENFEIVPSFYNFYSPASIVEGSIKTGKWEEDELGINLCYENHPSLELLRKSKDFFKGDLGNGETKEITNKKYIDEFKLQFSVMKNARKHHLNRINNVINPNEGIFGEGDCFNMDHYEFDLINA